MDKEIINEWVQEAETWLKQIGINMRLTYRPDLTGSYTLYCCIGEFKDQACLVKRYNPLHPEGGRTEVGNYRHFGHHAILPDLIALLPENAEEPQGILIQYFREELNTDELSLIEVLAIGLNLATIFAYFSFDDRNQIYFDLKRDSLRIDEHGGLRLIDLTDLMVPEELYWRGRNLPVQPGAYHLVPPEGQMYQEAYISFSKNLISLDEVAEAANRLRPEAYQTNSLARLIISLLLGKELADEEALKSLHSSSKFEPSSFTGGEQESFITLLESMLDSTPSSRCPLEEARKRLWSLIKPRITGETPTQAHSLNRARRLLRTLTLNKDDPVSFELHLMLGDFWRIT